MRDKMKGKGNDGSGDNEQRDDWQTPQWLFDLLKNQYNIEFDCCATPENSKCKEFSTNIEKEDVKNKVCWINPPFSKSKEMFEHFFRIAKAGGIGIYRCDNMETKVWQEIILKNANWIFIPKGRVSYCYNEKLRGGKGARFPSALIGFNLPKPIGIDGTTLFLK